MHTIIAGPEEEGGETNRSKAADISWTTLLPQTPDKKAGQSCENEDQPGAVNSWTRYVKPRQESWTILWEWRWTGSSLAAADLPPPPPPRHGGGGGWDIKGVDKTEMASVHPRQLFNTVLSSNQGEMVQRGGTPSTAEQRGCRPADHRRRRWESCKPLRSKQRSTRGRFWLGTGHTMRRVCVGTGMTVALGP